MKRQHFLVGLVFLASLTLCAGIQAAPAPPAGPEAPAAAAAPAAEQASVAPAASAADVPLVTEQVRQVMQDRDYPAAVRAIDQAAKAPNAPVGYLTYLKGRAHYLAKDYDQAAAVFEELAKAKPEGPWARRARFGKALALARKGDFRAAELIFRAEAEYLLSPARRQQIADIYLEFADRYFDPPKNELGEQKEKPNYERALEFYEQALEVGPKPQKRVEVELLVARCRQELGQHDQAAGLYEKFIEEQADSPLLIEARFRLGECRLAEGNRQAARRAWEDLLAAHAGSDSPRIAEAQYRLAGTWGIPSPGSDEELDLGTAALERFLKRFPEHELAAAAHLNIARSFLHRSRHEDAVAALKRFLADPRYQDREEVPEARSLLGTAYLQQGKYDEALAAWREYLAEHPAHKDWSEVQREIINTEYLKAQAKIEAEEYDAANELFAAFLAKYPLDPRNPRILLSMNLKFQHEEKWDEAIVNWRRLVSKYPQSDEASRAQYRIAVTLETEFGKLEEALKEYRKVTWGPSQSDARQAVARLTAKSMRIATERVFRSDETPRLKLTTRNIEKVSVRVYRVDLETYFRKMHLARGVEGLDTALIDPDATFEFAVPEYRKHQKLDSDVEVPLPGGDKSGVVAVTVSSQTLEATTMLVQSDLDVIVKSSRDEVFVFAENMRTSKPWPGARLLISNGRKVFAEGTTGEDGVFHKAYADLPSPQPSPGERGSLQADDVRVFAVSDGHTASNLVSLGGVGAARGLTSKGYIYTDRPAYRAGQLVHVRGCIRRVPGGEDLPVVLPGPVPAPPPQPAPQAVDEDVDPFGGGAEPPAADADPFGGGADPFGGDAPPDGPGPGPEANTPAPGDVYVVEAGKPYTVEVFDNRNRLVYEEEVQLGRFGTFHVHFVLPPTSPQGQYRVVARDLEGRSFQGVFQVHEYRLEPVRLVVDLPRTVYYRGEEIEGTIRAEYYYGAPLVDREIRYQLAGERTHTATTDERGEVKFKLATRDFRETQVLPLVVTLPQRNLTVTKNVVLASQGFSIGVSSVRSVYVAGETFEVEVATRDAEGEPVGKELKLKVLKQTTDGPRRRLGGMGVGRDGEQVQEVPGGGFMSVAPGSSRAVAERLVEEHDLKTDEADGTARQTLKLDEGGRYVIRVEGTDRFDNPISGSALVTISDDEDRVRLRILADRHTFKAGDTAPVVLHWREDPALALVTFQGARVLDYKLVALKKGPNKLDVPMTAELAPNFELAVAVMTDPRPDPKAAPEDKANAEADDDEDADLPVRRFHTASSPFTVERELLVTIETARADGGKGPVRPGEKVKVTVTTTDPQGKPVAAELSLAMVEQSLLDRFGWPMPAIDDFFRGQRRQPAVRTTSSITFDYRPATQPINPRLLAEEARLELAREEAASMAGEGAFAEAFGQERPIVAQVIRTQVVDAVNAARRQMVNDPDGARQNLQLTLETVRQAPDMDPRARQELVEVIEGDLRRANRRSGELANQHDDLIAADRELSLVVSQTQEVHEEIVDYLEANGDSRALSVRAYGGRAMSQGFGGMGGAYFGGAGYAAHDRRDLANAQPMVISVIPVVDGGWSFRHPTAGDLDQLRKPQGSAGVAVLFSDGTVQQFDVDDFDGDGAAQVTSVAVAAEMAKAGAVLLPGLVQQETGYWNPAVVTGEDGRATVEFTLPERSTAWKLLAKGITTDTLAGETTDELVVKKALFGELKLPLAFTEGDEARVLASVHNDLVEEGTIDVVLKTTIAGRTVEEKRTLKVTKKGIEELSFTVKLDRPQPADADEKETPQGTPRLEATFELSVSTEAEPGGAGGVAEVVRRTVPIRPYGMTVYATTGGSAAADTTAWIEPPGEMELRSPALQVYVGPTVERSLLDVVLGAAPWCQLEVGRFTSGLETTTSDLMAALALQELVSGTQQAAGPEAESLDARVRSAVSLLVSAQNDDGGFTWTGRGGKSAPLSTARAVWALSMAREAGYRVPQETWDKARAYLRGQLTASAAAHYELKAVLLHALSAAGEGDFALANRLHRSRPSLSAAAIAHLALAFAEMDRKETARELLGLLAERDLDAEATRRSAATGSLPWSHSPVELRALLALGLEEVAPGDAKLRELVDWLMAHRTGHRWTPDKATGPAAVALSRWFAKSRFEGERYELAVFVDDVRVARLDVDPAAGTQVIDVPGKLLKPQKQRINFQLTGRGRYTYQCTLGGYVPAEKLESTTEAWTVDRDYQPAPLEVDGKPIGRGFDIVRGSFQRFTNPLTQLPVGRRGMVELKVFRPYDADTPEQQFEYLVVTEPVPSGCTVIEKSVEGEFDRYEISPGEITFYVGTRRGASTIRYELFGYLPGAYRAAPTVVRNAHRPEQLAVAEPKPLRVLLEGGQSEDEYRLTPQELYELGRHYFDKKEWKTAAGHLTELLAKWKLDEEPYQRTVEMLLDAHLNTGVAGEIVRYFEIIKERWPTVEIPFEKILKVAAAYHELGEYERSYLVFRATVESSFRRESRVAGFLEGQGEFLRSVEVMGRLLREYPPEGYLAEATYALAQRVYAKAPEAADDPKLRELKVNRVDLVKRAWRMLEGFLTAYPEDPAADQAAFATANALLELETYDRAAAACDQYAKRYPESKLLDSFWYIIGYCRFATGQHQAAMAMCRKVAEARRTDPQTGREEESPNKNRAIYILGQIHHSLGRAAEAIAEYGKVADQFVDAAQSIAYFTRKDVELPEVTTIEPGKPAEAELKFRNVAECDLKVYRIDLMKFSLLKRNLRGITRINLAGIRPLHETVEKLGDGKDYRDRTHRLALPLKEEGAYLVVCRGENLHTSGLVLVTPLEIEVQEDAASGRVRATVKDSTTEKYLRDVHVKVIGSGNDEFISGETDLRGVFVADGIQGTTTVIAEADGGRYAFYRGSESLGVVEEEGVAAEAAAPSAAAPGEQPPPPAQFDFLESIKKSNVDFQTEQSGKLQQMYDAAPSMGVEAQKAF